MCLLGDSISVSPERSPIVAGRILDPYIWLARATPAGFTHAATYREGAGAIKGVTGLVGSVWSPDGRYLHTVAAPGSSVYVNARERATFATWRRDGGAPSLTQVTAFQFQVPKRPERSGITIEDGAPFTNSRKQGHRRPANPDTSFPSLRLANRPAFDGVRRRRFALRRPLQVDPGATSGCGVASGACTPSSPRSGAITTPTPTLLLVISDDIVLDPA